MATEAQLELSETVLKRHRPQAAAAAAPAMQAVAHA